MTFSHPDKKLAVHLEETAINCAKIISNNVFNFEVYDKNLIQEIAYIMGFCHDVGKSTKYFQEYLLSDGINITGPKNHALISSLFTHEFLKLFLNSKPIDDFYKNIILSFVYTSVKRHHGNLLNYIDELTGIQNKKKDELITQVKSIDENEYNDFMTVLFKKTGITYKLTEFKNVILSKTEFDSLCDFCMKKFIFEDEILAEGEALELFYLHNLLYSSLLLSDKTDVIIGESSKRDSVSANCLNIYRTQKGFDNPKSRIDEIKNSAFNELIENVKKVFSPENHFYSITLPTGLGKTLTSFGAAMEFKKLLPFKNAKIIITIPFTSIIDQNFEVYKNVLNTDSSTILLKHHHLAEPVYKKQEETLNYDKSSLLIESWQSEVVVTTFVQLLESIFTADKSKVMKLPNIANSIIIMDEIQTIDYEYWELINKTFKIIANTYNCYFILMTATQPLIFLPEKEITEIVPNHKKYYKYFNRTRIVNKANESIDFDLFISVIEEYSIANPDKDLLIILNTKKASRDCFTELLKRIDSDNYDLFYLSTLKTPFERKSIIQKIKAKNRPKSRIIVSTQLIEAGVDISVFAVFRELAPVDAIIQAAGRANRYSEQNEICNVFIYKIKETEASSKKVYGSILMNKTENVLKNYNEIEEIKYLELIEKYFEEIKKQSENLTSLELTDIKKWNFENLSKFSYIQERRSESIFVMLDENAQKIWEKYLEIQQKNTIAPYERKKLFAQIKSQFYDYVINVPLPYGKNRIDFITEPENFFYVWRYNDHDSISNYSYNPEDERLNTGYISKTLSIF